MCVCVCVCVCVSVCVCVCLCVSVCVCVCLCVSVCVCLCVCLSVCLFVCLDDTQAGQQQYPVSVRENERAKPASEFRVLHEICRNARRVRLQWHLLLLKIRGEAFLQHAALHLVSSNITCSKGTQKRAGMWVCVCWGMFALTQRHAHTRTRILSLSFSSNFSVFQCHLRSTAV